MNQIASLNDATSAQIIELDDLLLDSVLSGRSWFKLLSLLVNTPDISQQPLLRTRLTRFDALARQMDALEEERNTSKSMLDALRVSALLVNTSSKVMQMNEEANSFIHYHAHLQIKDGYFASSDNQFQRKIRQEIFNCATSSKEGVSFEQGQTRFYLLPIEEQSAPLVLILMSSMSYTSIKLEKIIRKIYSLTPAEAVLATRIVTGMTLDEAANDAGVSINTVRTQMKSVMKKSESHSQSDFIRKVFTHPAVISRSETTIEGVHKGMLTIREYGVRKVVTLRDKRLMEVRTLGNEQAKPVLFFRNLSGAAVGNIYNPLADCQLIVANRPGQGGSSPFPESLSHRRVSDIAYDIEQVLDKLNIDQFSVVGYGLGAPYAMATAALLKNRVHKLGLISPIAPVKSLKDFSEIFPVYQNFMKLAYINPEILLECGNVLVRGFLKDLRNYLPKIVQQLPAIDQKILGDLKTQSDVQKGFMNLTRGNRPTFLYELIQITSQWGFSLENINAETKIIHGVLDKHMPVSFAHRLHHLIDGSTFELVKDGGHLSVIESHWEQVLKWAIK